mgnify:CR=1 FL=1
MASSREYLDFVLEQLEGISGIDYKKMFGEYLVYVNERPVLTLCDNRVFVKKLPQVAVLMADAECGYPYEGAKEAYLLDLGDDARIDALLPMLMEHTPLPRPRKKKSE